MFDCLECGRKLKTLHARVFGEKPHYEPAGYHCEKCRTYYDASTKQASKTVYGVVRKNEQGGLLVAAENSAVYEPHANAALNACESEQERMRNTIVTSNGTSSSVECSLHETRQETRARRFLTLIRGKYLLPCQEF
jgi:hypothetical protein